MNINQANTIKVFSKTNGRCFYCNKIGEEIDHFISRAKWAEWDLNSYVGSVNDIENLFLSCKKCNRTKSDKCPEDFIGNSFIAWNRNARANRRIGIPADSGYGGEGWGIENGLRYLQEIEIKLFCGTYI